MQIKLPKSDLLIYFISAQMKYNFQLKWNILSAPSAVDRGFEPRSGQTNDYEIGMCCFSTNHVTLRRKIQDWQARIQ